MLKIHLRFNKLAGEAGSDRVRGLGVVVGVGTRERISGGGEGAREVCSSLYNSLRAARGLGVVEYLRLPDISV